MVKRDLITQIVVGLLLVVGFVVLRVWFFEPVTINGQMDNQYLKKDSVVLASKNSDITYGDFVLYQVDGKEYVGRIVAAQGDTVTYMDDVLYRNNKIIDENYLKRINKSEYYTEDMTIATLTQGEHVSVPKNEYLLLNDNRADKRDSRQFGLIAKKDIIGQVFFRISPLKQFGFIDTGLAE
ncbi:signal peptidase I [Streptococcus gallinaceus]|uniref:signal peptidase I n=1 Tax=Streptococcus gallinaceus TaxID=165758 RepID=UPI0020A09BF5|nr:signal peptidase I [Streptococcus gallinaceus]MCP1639295.1 signal peptidase I [Streptococcus gallinaceus]MCP1770061.1 signal peptidase I [Streptococcus gallinaceus]